MEDKKGLMFKFRQNTKLLGFTLAEVLITLSIIGIVADMTIPTIVASVQKQQHVTRLKKAYSQFNQVLAKMASDNGCVGNIACAIKTHNVELFPGAGMFFDEIDRDSFIKELSGYYKIATYCDATNNYCRFKTQNYSQYYDGKNRTQSQGYSFITIDGVAVSFEQIEANHCVVLFDTNGPMKGPNNWGRDVFIFDSRGASLTKFGDWKDGSAAPHECDSASTTYGGSCSARVMEEGWQMNY